MSAQASMQSIPLDRLSISPHNARKTGGANVADLAASILAHGLLQNLTVTDAGGDRFEVVAGGRRLRALQLLQDRGDLPNGLEVIPCRLVANGEVGEASTAENVIREPMHPADQFDAFRRMVDEGKPIADVAAHFTVSELVVKQRLKLAHVHPDLMQVYRTGGMSLEQLQALAVTDDQLAQHKAWFTAQTHDRHAGNLRAALTRDDVRGSSPLVRAVGIEIYKAAGGAVRQDLFATRDEVFLTDLPLLESLAQAKLQDIADAERAAGWSWVETHTAMDYGRERDYPVGAYPAGEPAYPSEVRARIEAIEKRLDEIDNIDGDELDQDANNSLADEQARLEDEYSSLQESGEEQWPEGTKEKSGVLIFLRDGDIHVERGRLKPGQKLDKKTGAIAGDGDRATAARTKPKPDHSDALLENLSAHRSAVACSHVARNPKIALALVVDYLWAICCHAHDHAGLLALSSTSVRDRLAVAPGLDRSLAVALEPALQAKVPKKDRLAWLHKQPEATLLQLLAFCVSKQINGVGPGKHHGIEAVHELLKFDVAKHWKATTDDYLSRVSAPMVVLAVREACGQAAADKLKGLKKPAMVAQAAKLLAGTGWLPKPLRGPGYALKKPATKKAEAKKGKSPSAKKALTKVAKAPALPATPHG